MADPDFAEALGDIAELAVELGAAGVAAEAAVLAERLAEGRFFVSLLRDLSASAERALEFVHLDAGKE